MTIREPGVSRYPTLTCCWAWILMYSALCLLCLPLSGLPAGPWVAFSREAPGVTTFMGGTLPPPLCGKKDRAGVGQSCVELQALGGVSGVRISSQRPVEARRPLPDSTQPNKTSVPSEPRLKASLQEMTRLGPILSKSPFVTSLSGRGAAGPFLGRHFFHSTLLGRTQYHSAPSKGHHPGPGGLVGTRGL